MTLIYALIIALSLVILFLAALVVGLLRGHAEVLRRLDALGVRLDDEDAPHEHNTFQPRTTTRAATPRTEIVGVNPDGDPVAISLAAGSDPVLLAFLSTSCSSCTVFWEGLDSSLKVFGSTRHRVVIVTLSEDEESPTRAGRLAVGAADVVMSSRVWADFEVPGAPYFVVLDARTRTVTGEGTSVSMAALESFVGDSANDQSWDRTRLDRSDQDRAETVDEELRRAGLEPGDPRLYHRPGDLDA